MMVQAKISTFESDYITADELVIRYKGKITKRTFANWRYQNQGPEWIKIGGRVMYSLSEVRKWEEKSKRGKL